MKYFNTLPSILQKDINGKEILVTNLLTRSYFLPSLLKNVVLFYDYDIREGDTPENIAYRYYNNVYRYWMILYSNNIIDPQSQWPLSGDVLLKNIYIKYRQDTANSLNVNVSSVTVAQTMTYTANTVHHYEKHITLYDSESLQKSIVVTNIDQDSYEKEETLMYKNSLPDGTEVTKEIQKKAISIYENEINQNESKRKIQLLKDSYAQDAEKKFKSLMGYNEYY